MANILHELTGLSITYSDPLLAVRNVGSATFKMELVGYSHTKESDWGDVSATIELAVDQVTIQEWFFNGLGRDIKVVDTGGNVVFRGFVNVIETTQGGIVSTTGPLTEVANKVWATYTPKLILANFTTDAGQTETNFAQDTISQGLYGIWQKVIQAGEAFVDPTTGYNQAEDSRDLYLARFKVPQTQADVSPNAQEISLRLYVRGYIDFLKAFVYQNRIYAETPPTVLTITDSIKAILNDNPNAAVLSTNQAFIGANPGLAPSNSNNYEVAFSAIENLLKTGDTTAGQWVFYLDADLKPHYELLPTTVEYRYRLTNQRQLVERLVDAVEVFPWQVQAGKYIVLTDWLQSGSYKPPLVIDAYEPRIRLLTSFNYTAPWDFSFSTGSLTLNDQLVIKKAGGNYR